MGTPQTTAVILSRTRLSLAAERTRTELERRAVQVVLPEPERRVLPFGPVDAVAGSVTFVLNRLLGLEVGLGHVLDWCEGFEQSLPREVQVFNRTSAVRTALSKRSQAEVFRRNGIRAPPTLLVGAASSASSIVGMLGLPLVLKPDNGLGGEGIVLCVTEADVEQLLSTLKGGSGVAQAFIPEARVTYRMLFVGDRLIASAERRSAAEDWRANFAQGASMAPIRVLDEDLDLGRSVMRATGLDIGGVDIVRASGGPYVLEVNPSPGLEGIERALDRNVAEEMVHEVLRRVETPASDEW